MSKTIESGDDWPDYYRGYRLQTNPDGNVWWQVYQGTDRLFLDPTPDGLIDDLLSLKRLGGRVRVTEDGDVITRVEADEGYDALYVGEYTLEGEFVPREAPEHSIDVRPTELSPGDLWPSIYDGAKFSFGGERVWWRHPQTHKRHPVETELGEDVLQTLRQLKPRGGSFRVTPWNDIITLVEDPPNPNRARTQLQALPRVIKNIIIMRRERGVEMLPVYVGTVDTTPIAVNKPRSLTDRLSSDEQAQLDSWAGSLGPTTTTDPDQHRARETESDIPTDDPTDW